MKRITDKNPNSYIYLTRWRKIQQWKILQRYEDIEKELEKLETIKQLMSNILIVDNRPVKNTTRKECYQVLMEIQELLEIDKRGVRK